MRDYFWGQYFKCQSDTQTLAIIPALHQYKNKRSASLQLITEEGAWNVDFPYEAFQHSKKRLPILIEKNYFGKRGIQLCLNTPECSAVGSLRFGSLSPIRYDIMGPFRYVPFMECRHSVLSMRHSVNGTIRVNGIPYHFQNAVGYIEGDRGSSFPKEYAWTQCFFHDGSLMLSVANIPFGAIHFTGVIGIIRWQGKEYRLATYLGAKAVRIEKGELVVRQGNTALSVKLIEKRTRPLRAPISGKMNRTIHESAACRAFYRFEQNAHTLFSFESSQASFEYEYLR